MLFPCFLWASTNYVCSQQASYKELLFQAELVVVPTRKECWFWHFVTFAPYKYRALLKEAGIVGTPWTFCRAVMKWGNLEQGHISTLAANQASWDARRWEVGGWRLAEAAAILAISVVEQFLPMPFFPGSRLSAVLALALPSSRFFPNSSFWILYYMTISSLQYRKHNNYLRAISALSLFFALIDTLYFSFTF